jgi:hypothetical protein
MVEFRVAWVDDHPPPRDTMLPVLCGQDAGLIPFEDSSREDPDHTIADQRRAAITLLDWEQCDLEPPRFGHGVESQAAGMS